MPKRTDIFSILIVGAGAALLAACGRETPPAKPDIRAERLAALDRIAEECRISRDVFELVGDNELRFRPRPDESYERVDCALTKLRETGPMRNVQMGFVGNEALSPKAANAQAH
jgi:hypothetical protein